MDTNPRIKKAVIYDYTRYAPNRCNNGGSYGYWITYTYMGNGQYEKTYNTTAEFEYCEYCGSFDSCGCDSSGESVTEKEVWDAIKDAQMDESQEIYAKFDLFEDYKDWAATLKGNVIKALAKTDDEQQIIYCAFRLGVDVYKEQN